MATDKTEMKYSFRKHISMFIRGIKIYSGFPKPIMLSIALSSVAEAIVPFINIYFAAQVLNELAGARDINRLIMFVLLTVLLNFAGFLIQRAAARFESYCRSISWQNASNAVSEKVLRMDYSDAESPTIQGQNSQLWQNQFYSDLGLMRLEELVKEAVQGMMRVILAVALAFTLFTRPVPIDSPYVWLSSPLAIVIVLLIFVGPIFLTPYFNMLGGKVWLDDNETKKKANKFFNYYFFDLPEDKTSAKDIRIYNQKRLIKARITEDPEFDWKIRPIFAKLMKNEGKYVAAGVAITFLCNGLIFMYVAMKAFAGAFGVGSIILYVGALTQLAMGLSTIMTSLTQLKNNNPFLAKWIEFLDIKSKMQKGDIKVTNDLVHNIEFQNVSFKYSGSDEYVLKNVSLKFNIGKRLAIVGENGSGKTTFIKLLCRLYDPSEGAILLNGVDIREYDYNEYMEIFSVVFQDFELLPFPLGQNVASSVNYDAERIMRALEDVGFGERLSSMPQGLETHLYKNFEEDGVEISGGEAQKIALARALYKDAPFVILDEPTAALDPIAEHEIYSSMNEIVGDKTAVFISHRLSSCRFCDDIAVFHEGELVQRGSHDSLVGNSNGKYFELWDAQAQYYQ